MPLLGLLHTLIAATFVIHAMRTGRPQYWMWIIVLFPLVGSLAYVGLEVLPELSRSRRGRRIKGQISDIITPDREWHRLREQVLLTGTVDAKRALAEECERKSMWAEAIELYRSAADGIFKDDPSLMTGLARSLLGAGQPQAALDTLDALQREHPDFESADAHMCYARSLEALERFEAAAQEYGQLSRYFVGLEARTRYGLLLMKLGEPDKARRIFTEVAKAGSVPGIALTDDDRSWLKVAKANL
ncbi:MAG: tetratricopeptide repeat protein [Hyphomicrobiaceae bacterium]|nr:tetratricopeptide repeat protein [Hyphomicrobiaceae bacterium]